eukprot:31458-Pelagococcus_subviridis.AAC.7
MDIVQIVQRENNDKMTSASRGGLQPDRLPRLPVPPLRRAPKRLLRLQVQPMLRDPKPLERRADPPHPLQPPAEARERLVRPPEVPHLPGADDASLDPVHGRAEPQRRRDRDRQRTQRGRHERVVGEGPRGRHRRRDGGQDGAERSGDGDERAAEFSRALIPAGAELAREQRVARGEHGLGEERQEPENLQRHLVRGARDDAQRRRGRGDRRVGPHPRKRADEEPADLAEHLRAIDDVRGLSARSDGREARGHDFFTRAAAETRDVGAGDARRGGIRVRVRVRVRAAERRDQQPVPHEPSEEHREREHLPRRDRARGSDESPPERPPLRVRGREEHRERREPRARPRAHRRDAVALADEDPLKAMLKGGVERRQKRG